MTHEINPMGGDGWVWDSSGYAGEAQTLTADTDFRKALEKHDRMGNVGLFRWVWCRREENGKAVPNEITLQALGLK
jgi:hypothetical protein